jgi:hypothetical protein
MEKRTFTVPCSGVAVDVMALLPSRACPFPVPALLRMSGFLFIPSLAWCRPRLGVNHLFAKTSVLAFSRLTATKMQFFRKFVYNVSTL